MENIEIHNKTRKLQKNLIGLSLSYTICEEGLDSRVERDFGPILMADRHRKQLGHFVG